MPHDALDVLVFIARPAAGKSEITHYLAGIPDDTRRGRFHIGPFDVLDDFPMLWTWFEEDDILERLGHPRLHSTPDRSFKDDVLWQVLIERLSLDYAKLLRDQPDYHETRTVIVEFARGAAHGGYRAAFEHLSEPLLKRAAVLYVDVSYEESLRKNRARFNPDCPDSILEHGLSDDQMERLYRDDDFATLSAPGAHWLTVGSTRVPYVVFENHDDITTKDGDALGARLEARLGQLWDLWCARA